MDNDYDSIEYTPEPQLISKHGLNMGMRQIAFNDSYCVIITKPVMEMDQYNVTAYARVANTNEGAEVECIVTSSFFDARDEFLKLCASLKLTTVTGAIS